MEFTCSSAGQTLRVFIAAVLLTVRTLSADADGKPVILEHPLDTIIPKGQPVTLNCKADGSPSPQISWYKDGQHVTTNMEESSSHRVLLPSGSLFFLKVESGKGSKVQDAGTYWCEARNANGETRSREAQLRIAMLRDDFRTRPRNVQAIVGQQAILECSPPKGFPEPVVSWKKDNRELRVDNDDRITVHSSGNLILTDVHQADSGFYTCVARNMVGIKESNTARLSVYEKPEFLQEPEDDTAEVGSDVLFTCRVSGDPMPVIVWRKKDGKMPLGRAQILESKGLRIERLDNCVIPTDEGEYICQAKNPAGAIETSARLTVHAPPTFSKEPTDQTVEEGGQAVFECEAVGNPLPAKFWSKEGDRDLMFPGHQSVDGRIKVSAGGRLSIMNVQSSDHGYFVCSALNAAGSNVAKAYLKVAGRSLVTQPPPIITQGPANQTIAIQSVAILPCKAVGHSEPAVSWLKNGAVLQQNNRYTQDSTGTLQIQQLVKQDSGIYTCKAKNADGETTWSASLTVEDHTNPGVTFDRMKEPTMYPSAPSKPVVKNRTETSIALQWIAPNKAGASPVTGYLLQYYSPEEGQTWFNVPDVVADEQYTVRSLRPASTYVFIVRAENEHGIGEPSAMSNIARTTGQPLHSTSGNADFDLELARTRLGSEQLVRLLEVKTLNATAVKLFWKQRRSEPLIAGYYVKWQGPPNSYRPTTTADGDTQPHSGHPDPNKWVNVTDATVNHAVVGKLMPYTTYTFFIVPYYRSVEGAPSNSLDGTTSEAAPVVAPRDVRTRMMNMTTLRVSWRPPPAHGINGALKGYHIVVQGNTSSQLRNITTSERAASVTLFHLTPLNTYRVQVAAMTSAGIGVYHGMDVVTMDARTLKQHLMLDMADQSCGFFCFVSNWYFIGLLLGIIWLAIMVLLFVIWYNKCNRTKHKTNSNSSPFIKINDGSVMTARDGAALFIDPTATFNSAQRQLLMQSQAGYTGSQADLIYQLQQQQQRQTDGGNLLDGPPPEYPGLGQPIMPQTGTLYRHQQPHQYAHLVNSHQNLVSTFNQPDMQQMHADNASPYATTTLVMQAHARNIAAQQAAQNGGTLSARSAPPVHPPPGIPGGSPVHTDNYIQQHGSGSDGSNGGYPTSHRRTGRPALADFLPPPPLEAPPPAPVNQLLNAADASRSAPLHRRQHNKQLMPAHGSNAQLIMHEHDALMEQQQAAAAVNADEYNYETLNDYLLRSFHSASPLHRQQQQQNNGTRQRRDASTGSKRRGRRAEDDVPMQEMDQGVSTSYAAGSSGNNTTAQRRAARSRVPPLEGHLADAEDDDDSGHSVPSSSDEQSDASHAAHRPAQPCMGVSASALTQSTYDNSTSQRSPHAQSPPTNIGNVNGTSSFQSSAARLRSLPRNSNNSQRQQDLV